MKAVMPMVKQKRWDIMAEGYDKDGILTTIEEVDCTSADIGEAFRTLNWGLLDFRFTALRIREVKHGERSKGISGANQMAGCAD